MADDSNPEVSLAERSIEAIILSVICVAALVGNIALSIIVLTDRKLKTPSNLLIVGLSCADMLVAAVNMPMTIVSMAFGEWRFSSSTCSVLGFVVMLTLCASVMHLAVISINRYILICHYSHFKKIYTYKNVAFMLIGTWLFCCLIAMPPLIGWSNYDYLPNSYVCFCDWKTDKAYTFFMVIVCFFGPLLAMSFSYFKIIRHVRASNKRLTSPAPKRIGKPTAQSGSMESSRTTTSDLEPASSFTDISHIPTSISKTSVSSVADVPKDVQLAHYLTNKMSTDTQETRTTSLENVSDPRSALEKRRREKYKKRRKEDVKLAMTFIIVILAFVISWLPFCVMMFWTIFATDSVPRIPDLITLILGFANSSYNPIIYGIMNKRFHAGYRRLFCVCIPCSSASSQCFHRHDQDHSATTGSSSSTGHWSTPRGLKARITEWRNKNK